MDDSPRSMINEFVNFYDMFAYAEMNKEKSPDDFFAEVKGMVESGHLKWPNDEDAMGVLDCKSGEEFLSSFNLLGTSEDGLVMVNLDELVSAMNFFLEIYSVGIDVQKDKSAIHYHNIDVESGNSMKIDGIKDLCEQILRIVMNASEMLKRYNEIQEENNRIRQEMESKINEMQEKINEVSSERDSFRNEVEGLNLLIKKDACGIVEEVRKTISNLSGDIEINGCFAADKDRERIVLDSDKDRIYGDDSVSGRPGVYGFMRPSWFTRLHTELSKQNAGQKEASKTSWILDRIFSFWKDLDSKKISVEEKADVVDQRRKEAIIKLLNDNDATNDEKYLKYILLTPGMDNDLKKSLNGAHEIGISADSVIRLLEQSSDSFNKEMVMDYISEAHKGIEYNLKQELAEELVRGEWKVICENANGDKEEMQLAPFERLNELLGEIDAACGILVGEMRPQKLKEDPPYAGGEAAKGLDGYYE